MRLRQVAVAQLWQRRTSSTYSNGRVLEGLALGTATLECLLLLHARADVGIYSQLVRVYLLKLAQNLLNELLCQLLLYSAQIFASAQ